MRISRVSGLVTALLVSMVCAVGAAEDHRYTASLAGSIRPLLAFLQDYPQAKACLLYGGKERLKVNGVLCLPCEEFLRGLVPDAPAPMD